MASIEQGWVVRTALPGDAAGIADVHTRAWQWAYRGLMPEAYLDGLEPGPRAAMWADAIAAGRAPLVAVGEHDVLGFAAAMSSRDEDADATTGEVGAIYLDPAVVGQGVGAALWRGVLAQLAAAGHRRVTVWVLDSNERGRTFYERMGLTPDGAEKADAVRGFPIREVRYCGSLQPG